MLDSLWPNADALAAMPYGAAIGAAAVFGLLYVRWRVKPGIFGEIEPRRFIPGEPVPEDMPADPWGPAGFFAAVLGGLVGASVAWVWTEPDRSMEQVGLLFAAIGLLTHLRRVLHVSWDAPVVGEAPPLDSKDGLSTRRRHAWEGLAMAVGGLLLAAYGSGLL